VQYWSASVIGWDRLIFWAHPELSAKSPQHVSGNFGLLDMIAVLQKINKNSAKSCGNSPM
jgi:para-nitrobenzyl esterase